MVMLWERVEETELRYVAQTGKKGKTRHNDQCKIAFADASWRGAAKDEENTTAQGKKR